MSCIDLILNEDRQYNLTTQHRHSHEEERMRHLITPEISKFIVLLSSQSHTPAQIIQKLRSKNHLHVTWNDVHYRWKETIKSKSMYDNDPFISSVKYAKNSENVMLVMGQTSPFALGVVTNIGKIATCLYNCTEAFIDYTYMINRSKLELFTVIVSVFGVGFPVGYPLLQKLNDEIPRMSSITRFLTSIKEAIPSLGSFVFFTDKYKGQMSAITSVFDISPSVVDVIPNRDGVAE